MSKPSRYEQRWLDMQTDKNKTYKHNPFVFRFPNNSRYQPDFYCVEDDIFIEITTTHKQDANINKMSIYYPEIQIKTIIVEKDKPIGKQFIVSLPKELHKDVKILAVDKNITLNALIVQAVEKLIKECDK